MKYYLEGNIILEPLLPPACLAECQSCCIDHSKCDIVLKAFYISWCVHSSNYRNRYNALK